MQSALPVVLDDASAAPVKSKPKSFRALVSFLIAVRRFAGALNPSYTYGKRTEPSSAAPEVRFSLRCQLVAQQKLGFRVPCQYHFRISLIPSAYARHTPPYDVPRI